MAENNSSAPLKTAEGDYGAGSEAKALAALRYYRHECSGHEPSLSVFEQMVDHALAAQAAPAAVVYAEARECSHCNHVGINDSADGVAACISCAWHGDSPKDDKCPECEAEGTMTASCPKCHHEYRLLADASIATPALPATEDSSAGDLAEVQAEPVHPDDAAVDALAAKMKAKLAKQRTKGYGGWDTPECSQIRLSAMLRDHVAKGDPVDVANFCAFLAARGEGIEAEVQSEPVIYVSRGQLENHTDPESDGGRYLPARRTPLGLLNYPLYTAPQTQPADARDAWQTIGSMPTCDDLIWLYCQDTNTIDGPVAPHPMYEDSWTHWAYAQAPSTATMDASMAAAQEGGNASAGKDGAA